MADTYCGKCCENCTHKEALQCPGCKAGPGSRHSTECYLANCCLEKGHKSCATCAFMASCDTLRRRDSLPEERLRARARAAEKQLRDEKCAALMGKHLWLLFWLVIPSNLAGVLSSLADSVPALYWPGTILTGLSTLAYGFILLLLHPANERYNKAGGFMLAGAAITLLTDLAGGGPDKINTTATMLFSLPAAILGLVGQRHEFKGHAEVLNNFDASLAEKWRKLWKWYMISLAVMIGSILLLPLFPLLGLLSILAGLVALIVTSIIKLILLYRSAKFFRTQHYILTH